MMKAEVALGLANENGSGDGYGWWSWHGSIQFGASGPSGFRPGTGKVESQNVPACNCITV
jgi:hypothetical protein